MFDTPTFCFSTCKICLDALKSEKCKTIRGIFYFNEDIFFDFLSLKRVILRIDKVRYFVHFRY